MNKTQTKCLRVGLTGGIASGKSSVAKILSQFGIETISADEIARDIMQKGSPILKQACQLFGNTILSSNGDLKRDTLREIIFNDQNARKQLNSITHPAIRQSLVKSANAANGPYVILEIPLLIESGLQSLVDRVLVVNIDKDTQVQRITERDKCSVSQAKNILKVQSSENERRRYADDLLNNTGGLEKLHHQVSLLHKKYLQLSKMDNAKNARFSGLDLH